MTKGELIVKCLKLLNENDGVNIESDTVSEDPDYLERTVNIVPSINRALNRLAEMKKLPVKSFEVPFTFENRRKTIKINQNEISDLLFVANVIKMDADYGLAETNVSYFLEGTTLILPSLIYAEFYQIFYHPLAKHLKEDDADTMQIEYPDYILDCIPYFVKADLFEEDNPNLAVLARNLFEQYANQIPTRNYSVMRGVKDVYDLY